MLVRTHSRHLKPLSRVVSGLRTQPPQPPARPPRVGYPVSEETRSISTRSAAQSASKSIFDEDESAWDHVFEGLGTTSGTGHKRKNWRPTRITAQEKNAFGHMYNMLFDPSGEGGHLPLDQWMPANDLALHLRHSSRNIQWTSEADQELDRKKEGMNLCHTDVQLLEWAAREVFGESIRYEKAARDSSWSSQKSIQLQPLSYPRVIEALMKTFRDKFADPYLALSIFHHARHLSVASYVFGCTSHAYNELIVTRWRCFGDLRGVCEALEEMRVNAIDMDSKTRRLAEIVRQEVGEKNLWREEGAVGTREVWDLVGRIEHLTAPKTSHRRNSTKTWFTAGEPWKHGDIEDTWQFNRWEDVVQPHT